MPYFCSRGLLKVLQDYKQGLEQLLSDKSLKESKDCNAEQLRINIRNNIQFLNNIQNGIKSISGADFGITARVAKAGLAILPASLDEKIIKEYLDSHCNVFYHIYSFNPGDQSSMIFDKLYILQKRLFEELSGLQEIRALKLDDTKEDADGLLDHAKTISAPFYKLKCGEKDGILHLGEQEEKTLILAIKKAKIKMSQNPTLSEDKALVLVAKMLARKIDARFKNVLELKEIPTKKKMILGENTLGFHFHKGTNWRGQVDEQIIIYWNSDGKLHESIISKNTHPQEYQDLRDCLNVRNFNQENAIELIESLVDITTEERTARSDKLQVLFSYKSIPFDIIPHLPNMIKAVVEKNCDKNKMQQIPDQMVESLKFFELQYNNLVILPSDSPSPKLIPGTIFLRLNKKKNRYYIYCDKYPTGTWFPSYKFIDLKLPAPGYSTNELPLIHSIMARCSIQDATLNTITTKNIKKYFETNQEYVDFNKKYKEELERIHLDLNPPSFAKIVMLQDVPTSAAEMKADTIAMIIKRGNLIAAWIDNGKIKTKEIPLFTPDAKDVRVKVIYKMLNLDFNKHLSTLIPLIVSTFDCTPIARKVSEHVYDLKHINMDELKTVHSMLEKQLVLFEKYEKQINKMIADLKIEDLSLKHELHIKYNPLMQYKILYDCISSYLDSFIIAEKQDAPSSGLELKDDSSVADKVEDTFTQIKMLEDSDAKVVITEVPEGSIFIKRTLNQHCDSYTAYWVEEYYGISHLMSRNLTAIELMDLKLPPVGETSDDIPLIRKIRMRYRIKSDDAASSFTSCLLTSVLTEDLNKSAREIHTETAIQSRASSLQHALDKKPADMLYICERYSKALESLACYEKEGGSVEQYSKTITEIFKDLGIDASQQEYYESNCYIGDYFNYPINHFVKYKKILLDLIKFTEEKYPNSVILSKIIKNKQYESVEKKIADSAEFLEIKTHVDALEQNLSDLKIEEQKIEVQYKSALDFLSRIEDKIMKSENNPQQIIEILDSLEIKDSKAQEFIDLVCIECGGKRKRGYDSFFFLYYKSKLEGLIKTAQEKYPSTCIKPVSKETLAPSESPTSISSLSNQSSPDSVSSLSSSESPSSSSSLSRLSSPESELSVSSSINPLSVSESPSETKEINPIPVQKHFGTVTILGDDEDGNEDGSVLDDRTSIPIPEEYQSILVADKSKLDVRHSQLKKSSAFELLDDEKQHQVDKSDAEKDDNNENGALDDKMSTDSLPHDEQLHQAAQATHADGEGSKEKKTEIVIHNHQEMHDRLPQIDIETPQEELKILSPEEFYSQLECEELKKRDSQLEIVTRFYEEDIIQFGNFKHNIDDFKGRFSISSHDKDQFLTKAYDVIIQSDTTVGHRLGTKIAKKIGEVLFTLTSKNDREILKGLVDDESKLCHLYWQQKIETIRQECDERIKLITDQKSQFTEFKIQLDTFELSLLNFRKNHNRLTDLDSQFDSTEFKYQDTVQALRTGLTKLSEEQKQFSELEGEIQRLESELPSESKYQSLNTTVTQTDNPFLKLLQQKTQSLNPKDDHKRLNQVKEKFARRKQAVKNEIERLKSEIERIEQKEFTEVKLTIQSLRERFDHFQSQDSLERKVLQLRASIQSFEFKETKQMELETLGFYQKDLEKAKEIKDDKIIAQASREISAIESLIKPYLKSDNPKIIAKKESMIISLLGEIRESSSRLKSINKEVSAFQEKVTSELHKVEQEIKKRERIRERAKLMKQLEEKKEEERRQKEALELKEQELKAQELKAQELKAQQQEEEQKRKDNEHKAQTHGGSLPQRPQSTQDDLKVPETLSDEDNVKKIKDILLENKYTVHYLFFKDVGHEITDGKKTNHVSRRAYKIFNAIKEYEIDKDSDKLYKKINRIIGSATTETVSTSCFSFWERSQDTADNHGAIMNLVRGRLKK